MVMRSSSCSARRQLSCPARAAQCAGVWPAAAAAVRVAPWPSSWSTRRLPSCPASAAQCAGVWPSGSAAAR
eukprot:7378926-Prymnesium_polylepis.1